MKTLTITRGLPGSGKSTWAKAQPNAARINRDDLRKMLYGTASHEHASEQQVTLVQHAAVRALLTDGVDVICDDTNLRARYVRALFEVAAECGAEAVIEDFTDVPLEVCLARDAAREDPVGEQVIRRLHERFLAGKRPRFDAPQAQATRRYEPDTSLPDAILVDVDGTVALTGDRSPYDMTRVALDQPNHLVITAIRAMHHAGHAIVYCSGRTDDARQATADWLDTHVGLPYAALHMRAVGDTRKDSVVKREIFDLQIRRNWNVVGVFDDRNQVVRMWRDLGLTVFQVADGNF
jgi:predicted kinase